MENERRLHDKGHIALTLAAQGFRVFPLKPNSKLPALRQWPQRATREASRIRLWWAQDDYNIAIACDRAEDEPDAMSLIVIDYDCKPGQQGAATLEVHRLLGLTDTYAVKTPNGQHHYWWSKNSIPNSVGKIAPHVDIRGYHGYVVAPGSVVDGKLYKRVDGSEPTPQLIPEEFATLAATRPEKTTATIIKMPIAPMDTPQAIERVRTYLINDAPEAIQGQHGDTTTFKVACRVKDLGVSQETCLQMMAEHWNEEKASPSWDLLELSEKVSNAYKYGESPPGIASPELEFASEIQFYKQHQGAATEQAERATPGATLPATPIKTRNVFPLKVESIPPRDWIVPGLLLRRHLTMLVAPPGSGKSLLSLQLAIMTATGMNWGGWNPRQRQKVLIVNAEDDKDEMHRRLYAAAQEMGVDHENLANRIELAESPESLVVARVEGRRILRTPLADQMVETIRARDIGTIIVDPFAETFEGDENDNSEIKWAGVLWRSIFRVTNSTGLLVHHSRKYADQEAGNPDITRGGGSLIGIARVLTTLFPMTVTEARIMGVAEDEKHDYVRFDDAKANYSRRGAVRWFHKKTITLDNAQDTIPGDDVGVLVPWKPDIMEGVTEQMLDLVRVRIDRGVTDQNNEPTGALFGASAAGRNNDRWVGHVICAEFGVSEDKAKAIVKEWLAKGWLEYKEYRNDQRQAQKGVVCSAEKWPKNVPGIE